MGYLQYVLNKAKEKIVDFKESKKRINEIVIEEAKLDTTEPIIVDNEVEDWYHDVGARGGFKR